MPDPLHFSVWFPDFSGPEMLPHIVAVLQQFPFSARRPGITYVAVQPVSWNEATVLERRFSPGVEIPEAVAVAADLIHDDYAYVFEANWDLWTPANLKHDGVEPNNDESKDESKKDWLPNHNTTGNWDLVPSAVRFVVQGEEFDERTSEETGNILVDLGLDSWFLQENVSLTDEAQATVRENVARLLQFTLLVEKNTRASSRLLWSESEENLAQKLIARLQRLQ